MSKNDNAKSQPDSWQPWQKITAVILSGIVAYTLIALSANAIAEEAVPAPEIVEPVEADVPTVEEAETPEDERGIRDRLSAAWSFVIDEDASGILEDQAQDLQAQLLAVEQERAELEAQAEEVALMQSDWAQKLAAAETKDDVANERIESLNACVSAAMGGGS